MDIDYYSDKTIIEFLKKTVCQNDETLYRYLMNENIGKFRKRLITLGVSHKQIEKIIYAYVTDGLRDEIFKIIENLTKFMKPMGDLIVTGGEAFNFYFTRDTRIITSDIDTKFVPRFRGFQNLQAAKLILWNELGTQAKKIEDEIRLRISFLKKTRIGKVFGITLPKDVPVVTRRYTLIKKRKQSPNTNNKVIPEDVLIDVEVFALDLKMKYFSTSENKVGLHNLGGILDIAFMRPGEFGSEVASYFPETKIIYRNATTKKPIFSSDILIASKTFLLHDLYIMQSLGLRPEKKDKDRKRMVRFARDVLDIKNVTSSDSINAIFKKSLKFLSKDSKPPNPTPFPRYLTMKAKRIDPYKWSERTTKPIVKKLALTGLKGPRGLTIEGLKPTSGPFRFNMNKLRWVKNTNNSYVKNEYNYRIPESKEPSNSMPYGYNPIRDRYSDKTILTSAAQIPLVGLKNTTNK